MTLHQSCQPLRLNQSTLIFLLYFITPIGGEKTPLFSSLKVTTCTKKIYINDYNNNEIRKTFWKKNLGPLFMKKRVSTGYRFSRPTLLLLEIERTQDICHSQVIKSRRHTLLCVCVFDSSLFFLF